MVWYGMAVTYPTEPRGGRMCDGEPSQWQAVTMAIASGHRTQ